MPDKVLYITGITPAVVSVLLGIRYPLQRGWWQRNGRIGGGPCIPGRCVRIGSAGSIVGAVSLPQRVRYRTVGPCRRGRYR